MNKDQQKSPEINKDPQEARLSTMGKKYDEWTAAMNQTYQSGVVGINK